MLLNFGVCLSVTNTNFDHDGSHKYTCHQDTVGLRLIINFFLSLWSSVTACLGHLGEDSSL